jgi:hypothetical protein
MHSSKILLLLAALSSSLSASCTDVARDPLDFGAAHAKPPVIEAKPPHVQAKTLIPPSHSSGVGTNLVEVSEYGTSWPFKNAFKQARGWISTDGTAWDDGRPVAVNERGWVTSLQTNQKARALVIWGEGLQFPGGTWQVRWKGTGTIDLWPQGDVSSSTGEGNASFSADWKKGGIAITITKTSSSDPIRDIEVFAPGAEASTSSFHPAWLEGLKGYGTLRFMDWMKTNQSTIVTPNDRPVVNDARWLDKGVPVEAILELCNVAATDCWINIGHTWNDALVEAVAVVARDTLQKNRRLYVESSNEVWNGIFPQATFAKNRAVAAEISSDAFEGQMRWHARRSLQVHAIFDRVFGAENTRVVRVLGGWAANAWSTGIMLDEVKKKDGVVDAVAIAPYFGNAFGEPEQRAMVQGLDVAALMKKLDGAVDESLAWVAAQKKVTDKYKTSLVAYEGGQHLVGVGPVAEDAAINALFDSANASALLKPIYARYLAGWKASGAGLFLHFNDVMRPTKYGRWGARQFQSQPRAEAPKYDALMTFIEATPRWF